MTKVRIELSGDRQAGLRFEQFPNELRDDLATEIGKLTEELYDRILPGIPVESGDLKSRLKGKVFNDEDRIKGYIVIAAKDRNEHRKAAALEFGSRGKPIDVKAHRRRIMSKLLGTHWVKIKAGTRKPNIKEHKYLRNPVSAMRSEVNTRLNAIVETAVKDANS